MSADNLPRPATPGPWEAEYDDGFVDDDQPAYEPGWLVRNDDRTFLELPSAAADDARAIASLPERIRRMDGIRRVAEDGLDYEPTAYQQGYAAACQAVLRWLDGEVE